MVSEGILSASEFGSEDEANYQLQSAQGQMLMQERQLLSKFVSLGLFSNFGEDGILGIAKLRNLDTKRIKQIILEIKNRQSNAKVKGNNDKVRYDELIKEIKSSSEKNTADLQTKYKKMVNDIKIDDNNQKPVNKILSEELHIYPNLIYSTSTNMLKYRGKEVQLSPETREIKFLLAIYNKRGQTVEYKALIKEVGSQIYKDLSDNGKVPLDKLQNKDFSEESAFLKRDFRKIVVSLEMSDDEFKNMIKTISKRGYKLTQN